MNLDNIDFYLELGKDNKYWYEKESLKLKEMLPEFKNLPIIRCFAVTSMTTSIEANVSLAIKALIQLYNNLEFKGFLPNQIKYLNLIKNNKDVPGRKIMSFIKALEGDSNSVVIDIWMCRAFGIINERILNTKGHTRKYFRAPSRKEYDIMEFACITEAKKRNITPREFQSMIWSGIKISESNLSKNISWADILIKKRGIFPYV